MGHPEIENQTSFAFEPLFVSDENGCPLLVAVVKATFHIAVGSRIRLAEQQTPVNPTGEWWGKPEDSSCKYEPEIAFDKPATDIVLIGSACAQRTIDTEIEVRLTFGSLDKRVHVYGDRCWGKVFGTPCISPAERFENIPLVYERAFGGWDRSHPDPAAHTCEPRNPVGVGFRDRRARFEDGVPLPNLEDPRYRIVKWGDTTGPACFGFVSPNWQPRASLAGSYDDDWIRDRMPLLPKSFHRAFFNAASAGLVCADGITGGEEVVVWNVSRNGPIAFQLPRIPPPSCWVAFKGGPDVHLQTRLDTVIINSDERLLFLLWRAHTTLRNGPHDVAAIRVRTEPVSDAWNAGRGPISR
jgi:hypothetical protein